MVILLCWTLLWDIEDALGRYHSLKHDELPFLLVASIADLDQQVRLHWLHILHHNLHGPMPSLQGHRDFK